MNIEIDKLKMIGQGATSSVFLLDDQKVLKLFNNRFSQDAVDYEARIAYEIQKLDISAPKIYDTISVNDQPGILYEYIKGKSLIEELLSNRNRIKAIVEEMVGTQMAINKMQSSSLPNQCTRINEQISKTHIDKDIKEKINGFLESLPGKNHVCHGDFHVGNLIRTHHGLVVLDWMNCYSGHAEGDIIRSILIMESPYIPFDTNFLQGFLFKRFKKKFARIYKKTVQKTYKIRNYKAWLVIIAAVRLSDNIPNEERWLRKIIQRNHRHLNRVSA